MRKIKPSELVSENQKKIISLKKDWINILSLSFNWILIFTGIGLFFFFPSWLMFIASVIIIGSRQFALSVLAHDAAHRLLFSNLKINDWAGQWLCAYPIFSDNRQYRPYHLEHHRHTETDEDPDKVLSAPFPISKKSFLRKVLRDLTGLTGFKRYSSSIVSIFSSKKSQKNSKTAVILNKILGFLVTNLVIFCLVSILFDWSSYFILWWLPAFTYFSLIIRIRNIAEHAVTPGNSDFDNTRTTKATWLLRFLMVPHHVNYHLEHHLFTYCPWYNLPAAHKILIENGYENEMCIETSYLSVLTRATNG